MDSLYDVVLENIKKYPARIFISNKYNSIISYKYCGNKVDNKLRLNKDFIKIRKNYYFDKNRNILFYMINNKLVPLGYCKFNRKVLELNKIPIDDLEDIYKYSYIHPESDTISFIIINYYKYKDFSWN